ncbi:hypothetical protein CS542_04785 [Pedobacter sp. IW39]|nr:hypothetical protein CS542_04785 [Pedobacter sp. IW39]
MGMIDNILDKPYIDHQQNIRWRTFYGGGTLELLRRKPKTFAAAFQSAEVITLQTLKIQTFLGFSREKMM